MRRRQRQLKSRNAWRSLWLRFAAIAIGCQFLVPAGYMPGALADGTPFVLCHMYTGALDLGSRDAHEPAGHAAHHDAAIHEHAAGTDEAPAHENHTGAEAWEHCPLGALSAAAALAPALAPEPAARVHERLSTTSTARAGIGALIDLRARAPPTPRIRLFA
jgi:hypothetical protein